MSGVTQGEFILSLAAIAAFCAGGWQLIKAFRHRDTIPMKEAANENPEPQPDPGQAPEPIPPTPWSQSVSDEERERWKQKVRSEARQGRSLSR